MTRSEGKFVDNAVAGLAPLEPLRSVWPEMEEHLDRMKQRQCWKQRLRVASFALAATLVLAVVLSAVMTSWGPQVDFQQTVDAAVRDAMPTPVFSGHQFDVDKSPLDTLLVSAKPRTEVKTHYPSQTQPENAVNSDANSHVESHQENPINEF